MPLTFLQSDTLFLNTLPHVYFVLLINFHPEEMAGEVSYWEEKGFSGCFMANLSSKVLQREWIDAIFFLQFELLLSELPPRTLLSLRGRSSRMDSERLSQSCRTQCPAPNEAACIMSDKPIGDGLFCSLRQKGLYVHVCVCVYISECVCEYICCL